MGILHLRHFELFNFPAFSNTQLPQLSIILSQNLFNHTLYNEKLILQRKMIT